MSAYYILKLESQPTAQGEYIGPFANQAERDAQASRLREKRGCGRNRTICYYRVDMDPSLAGKLVTPAEYAA